MIVKVFVCTVKYLGKYIELGAKNDYVNGKKLISKLFAVTPDWSGYLEKQKKELDSKMELKILSSIDKNFQVLEKTEKQEKVNRK